MDPKLNCKSEQLEALWKFKSQAKSKIPGLITLWPNFRFTSRVQLSQRPAKFSTSSSKGLKWDAAHTWTSFQTLVGSFLLGHISATSSQFFSEDFLSWSCVSYFNFLLSFLVVFWLTQFIIVIMSRSCFSFLNGSIST